MLIFFVRRAGRWLTTTQPREEGRVGVGRSPARRSTPRLCSVEISDPGCKQVETPWGRRRQQRAHTRRPLFFGAPPANCANRAGHRLFFDLESRVGPGQANARKWPMLEKAKAWTRQEEWKARKNKTRSGRQKKEESAVNTEKYG
eukprot:gene205-biopygen44